MLTCSNAAIITIKVNIPAEAMRTSFLVILIFGAELITAANSKTVAEIIKANNVA